MTREQGGRLVRQVWIDGVHRYYQGEVKDSWVTPWERMREWEQQVIMGVYEDVSAFVQANDHNSLSREQGGMLVREAWIVHCYKVLGPDVKPAYVGAWAAMPKWEQDVDCNMYEAIAGSVLSAAA